MTCIHMVSGKRWVTDLGAGDVNQLLNKAVTPFIHIKMRGKAFPTALRVAAIEAIEPIQTEED
jgi:hypothetical protein